MLLIRVCRHIVADICRYGYLPLRQSAVVDQMSHVAWHVRVRVCACVRMFVYVLRLSRVMSCVFGGLVVIILRISGGIVCMVSAVTEICRCRILRAFVLREGDQVIGVGIVAANCF